MAQKSKGPSQSFNFSTSAPEAPSSSLQNDRKMWENACEPTSRMVIDFMILLNMRMVLYY